MTLQVIIRPRALGDLQEARKWYEQQRAGLGDEFTSQVEKVISSLESSAEITPEYYRGFRRLLTVRFPFKVFYRIEGERVLVFRILHASRDHERGLIDGIRS